MVKLTHTDFFHLCTIIIVDYNYIPLQRKVRVYFYPCVFVRKRFFFHILVAFNFEITRSQLSVKKYLSVMVEHNFCLTQFVKACDIMGFIF